MTLSPVRVLITINVDFLSGAWLAFKGISFANPCSTMLAFLCGFRAERTVRLFLEENTIYEPNLYAYDLFDAIDEYFGLYFDDFHWL